MINKEPSKESRKAAIESINGKDPTNGALYFYDTSSKSDYLLSKPTSIQCGKLIFAY